MKRFVAFILLGTTNLLRAQLIPLPPSSVQEGVIIQPAGINAGARFWGNNQALGSYRFSGDGYQSPLQPGKADNQLGLIWTTTAPTSLTSARQSLNTTGGFVRVIFLGETAGWLNNFGYTYSGNPTGPESYTAWSEIQSYGCKPNIKFGDHFDLSLAAGQMSNFDLWFSATGAFGSRPTSLTDLGGVYTAFNPLQNSVSTSQFLWAGSSLSVNTWSPSLSASVSVTTYLVGIEDWRIGCGADRDYNDFVFALQFFGTDGSPIAAVPEPKSWAAIAGAAALAYVLWIRLRSRQAA